AATVEDAFAGMPAPTLSPDWVDWVAERLAAKRPAAPALRLLAPRRDEPTPEKVFSALLLTPVTEPTVTAAAPRLVAQRDDSATEKAAGDIGLAAPMRAAPMSETLTSDSAMAAPVEGVLPPAETMPRRNWLDWGATLG